MLRPPEDSLPFGSSLVISGQVIATDGFYVGFPVIIQGALY